MSKTSQVAVETVEPSCTQHRPPLLRRSGRRHSQSLQSGDMRKPFTAQDFSIMIWYKHKTKGYFINATGLLDRGERFVVLCRTCCAKCRISLPCINFPLSLNILFFCILQCITLLRLLSCPNPFVTPLPAPSLPQSCPCFFVRCALPLFLLPPVSSSHGQRCLGHAAGRSYAL